MTGAGPGLSLREPTAAVLAVGTELTLGLIQDTNASEISRALASAGVVVRETAAVADDVDAIAEAFTRLASRNSLVISTGGLGPTHDDVTREGAALAFGLALAPDPTLEEMLADVVDRHEEERARAQVLRQALVLEGATFFAPDSGTAPGQLLRTADGAVALLPGPPHEMRPMLAHLVSELGGSEEGLVTLSCVGITESDAQVRAQRALGGTRGVGLTMLAGLGVVRVILRDTGAGPETLAHLTHSVRQALGDACFDDAGTSLEEVVVSTASSRGATLATAESCTGGLVASRITSVPGASAVYLGSVVAYADEVKTQTLGVAQAILDEHGAVSPVTAEAMAAGVADLLGATHAVAVTGVAGPEGGTRDKPVGMVCFGLFGPDGPSSYTERFHGDRDSIRERATVFALDLVRRSLES